MQINAISELSRISIPYNGTLSVSEALNGENKTLIEVSYLTSDKNYDSKNIDLYSVLSAIYVSFNALSSDVTTLREQYKKSVNDLSTDYIERLANLKKDLLNLISAVSSDILGRIAEVSNNVGENYLNKNNSDDTQLVRGPIVFSSELTGTITRSLSADCSYWS